MHETNSRTDELSGFLESIMEDNGEKWFKFVLRVVGNREDAEDAVQEGVCRVLSCDRVFATEEEARMYLARSISNTAFEIYKYRKRQRARLGPTSANLIAAPGKCNPHTLMEDVEREVERRVLLSALNEALVRLPVREHEALSWTLLEGDGGSSIREAGAARGIPYSTLRHRRNEGLRHLRKYLIRLLRSRVPHLVLA